MSVTRQFPDIQIKVDHISGHVAIVNKDEDMPFKVNILIEIIKIFFLINI